MKNNPDKHLLKELKNVMDDKYFSYALELFTELEDQYSEKSILLKKQIYEGFLQETKKFIDFKLNKRIKKYIRKKNFRLLDTELKILEKNLDYFKKRISKLDPGEKLERKFKSDIYPWKKLHENFERYKQYVMAQIIYYREKYDHLIEKIKQKLRKKQEKRRKKLKKKKKINEEEIKPKVELILEMYEANNNENFVEYLPFLGVTSIRIRVLVNEPIKKLIIRPKLNTNLYAENVEWSNYVCGMNNENIEHDLTKGMIAIHGGGKPEGFVMYNPPAESYAFFFLRHHDKTIKEQIDYSMTFEAVEEISENDELLLSSITIQLKYPEAIRPYYEIELPDATGPYNPVHAIYKFDHKKNGRMGGTYKEIIFEGSQIPEYYPRWYPPQKIKYFPIKNSEKISNLFIRSYSDGTADIFYRINGAPHQIGELKGRLTSDVFKDPLQMTTAEIFRFFSDDFIVLRIWFWWIDQRLNRKLFKLKHEMPDCERVDFVIDLRNPNVNQQMVPFICTDIHWKEFWLDTRDVTGEVKVKFTPTGIDFRNNQQLFAFFAHHHEGVMHHPLPAIVNEIFRWIGDKKTFYCVLCGERTFLPENIPLARDLIEDLSEDACRKRNRKIIEEMSDMICPACGKFIMKEEKLQYMFLFEDNSKFKKHLKKDILHNSPALKLGRKAVNGGSQPLSLKRQNCHVPVPLDGITSKDWCSSTVIRPLSLKRITFVKNSKEKIKKIDIISVSDLEELNQKIAIRLAKIGILKLKDLIKANLKEIVEKIDLTGFSEAEIDDFHYYLPRWQQMAELYQIRGIGSQYSDLLIEIGENLSKLRKEKDPLDLLEKIETYNAIRNDIRRLPSLNQIENWIQQSSAI